MRYSGLIEIPYNLPEYALRIEPSVDGTKTDWEDLFSWFNRSVPNRDYPVETEEMFQRIFTAAVLLCHSTGKPFGQCLETAIIWEVG